MKQFLIVLGVLLLGAAAVAVLLLTRRQPERREAAKERPFVRVLAVEKEKRQLSVFAHGTVTPRTEITLVAQVGGRILSVAPSFADGGFFAKGEELVRIDPADYDLAVVTAQAQVAQAQRRLSWEEAEAAMALREWEAMGKGTPTDLVLRKPQIAEARAALSAAEASLAQARLHLERTILRAPFDGRVREKRVDVGQVVSPGTPLAVLYAVDEAEVRLPIALRDLAFVDLPLAGSSGTPAEVVLRATVGGKEAEWRGTVVRTEAELDPRTRMLSAIVRVSRPYASDPPLLVGLFVEGEILGRAVDGVIALPRSALRGPDRVYVLDPGGRLRIRPVDVLRADAATAILRGGLESGERVVVSGLDVVVDGMEVQEAK